MVTIIDYGMGNIGSLENMLKKVGSKVEITSSYARVNEAEKIILPGVGQFDNAIKKLRELDLISILNKKVLNERIPILCICLGAQLVTQNSEEGNLPGFGWVQARTIRFKIDEGYNFKIPHMGWNDVNIQKESVLFKNMYPEPCFYFVHSYHFVCDKTEDILTTTVYGYEFASAIEHENIYATQFHPEKSHKYGMQLIKNFVEL